MGDLNAKIGGDNRDYGNSEMIANGEMFADLCASKRLVIGGNVFRHRRIRKATWISPDRR